MAEPLPAGAKQVFVTRSTYSGNLGGLSGADSLCASSAAAGGLTGTFKAWVSDKPPVGRTSPTVAAIDRITSAGPFYLVGVEDDGTRTKVFASKAALASAPLAPISRNELGETVNGVNVWTGTLSTGQPVTASGPPNPTYSNLDDDNSCAGWSKSGPSGDLTKGQLGTVYGTAGQWTEFTKGFCTVKNALYCFEN